MMSLMLPLLLAQAVPPVGVVAEPCDPPPRDQAERLARDWAQLCRYRADNARAQAGPASARRVVFIGDSITEGWSRAHPEFFAGRYLNRGISGQTTPQMLVRFRADVIALRPRAVHILAGINDIAGNTGPTTEQAIRDNVMAMTELAKANGIRVVLAATMPADRFVWRPGIRPAATVRAHVAWLKDYARASGAVFVDYYTPLATADGAMKPEYSADGVHLNRTGYDTIEPLALAALAKAGVR